MVIDLGAGDGAAAYRRARRDGRSLVVAIEPVAEQLREVSRRAARAPGKGGVANLLCLAGTADELPWLLAGRADTIVIALPWGSLLRGVALPDADLVSGLCATLRPAGRLDLLLSVGERDAASRLPTLDTERALALVNAYRGHGFACLDVRPADVADVNEMSAGWGRRLGIPQRRTAWRITLQRA